MTTETMANTFAIGLVKAVGRIEALEVERNAAQAEIERLRLAEAEAMALVLSHEGHIERLTTELSALKAEHKDAMEVLATVAQINGYYPGETFPRAITTNNRFMAAVDEVGKLKARVEEQNMK